MKMKSLLGIVLSLSILQSCQNDETNIIQNEVNNKGITFSSIIDDAQNSRAYDTSWEANDVIGVFMLATIVIKMYWLQTFLMQHLKETAIS